MVLLPVVKFATYSILLKLIIYTKLFTSNFVFSLEILPLGVIPGNGRHGKGCIFISSFIILKGYISTLLKKIEHKLFNDEGKIGSF